MANSVKLTTEQISCIKHDKGNVIVSASAGSGKTHVIIERIIRLVKEKRVDVDKILVVTFTRLSANEMKEKLKKALIDEFNKTGDVFFKQQTNNVNIADISTIHSFLANILRSYFYKINLDANFEVADDKRSGKIKNQALNELFEELYERGDEDFLELLSYYSSKRDDKGLKKIILDIYDFSTSEESIQTLREKSLKFHKEAYACQKLECVDIAELKKEEEKSIKLINSLLDLTEKLKEIYEILKQEANVVDFSDLEFKSLKLFEDEVALKEIKEKYVYIFVDEYQDVNSVQEKIINKISSNNAFMVGDIKQSIYGFRGCNPKYFHEKHNKYLNKDGGKAFSLNQNFRSASNIVIAVNNVFNKIMKKDVCDYDYENNHQMIYGNGYQDYEGEAVIHLIENDVLPPVKKNSFEEVYSVVQNFEKVSETHFGNQELAVIKIINDVLDKPYFDVKSGTYKRVKYEDICVLSRSLKGIGTSLIKAMLRFNIPVSSSVKNSVSEYPEIKALYSAVKAVCFMQSDVELATVMLNYGNFTEEELACIRGNEDRALSFYECVTKISNGNTNLSKKVKKFLEWFSEIRLLSDYLSASEILRRIISDSEWDLKLLSSPFGKAKMDRVERFISEADFSSKPMSILEFNEYLEEFIDEISLTETESDGTVKIMTAHASKGLEFPIVIVVGVNKLFSSDDMKHEVYMDRDRGIVPKGYNLDTMTVFETPAVKIIKSEFKNKRAVEEARLFYVELTRAKCELHVVVDNDVLFDTHDGGSFIEAIKQKDFLTSKDMKVEFFKASELQEIIQKESGEVYVAGKAEYDDAVSALKENLSFKYEHLKATTLPLKSSVSKENQTQEEYYKTSNVFGETSSETGTAYHKFLELSSLNSDLVEEELNAFIKDGIITAVEAELLNVNKLKSILSMPIFKSIKDKKVYKERKFCLFVNAEELGYDSSEKVLIQGVIDLIVECENGVTLIDYKLSKIELEEDIVKKYKK
ncbi:MAG: UvrD-helicase domain-containing protein, partial [Clostridia bacterium]|nr:UvrD-helicase domain-containing protein [Clostridia bacterium]